MDHLHRSILRRVLFAWAVLSLLALGGAFLAGMWRLDQVASAAALEAVRRLMPPGGPGPQPGEGPASRAPLFPQSQILMVKVYDRRGALLSETLDPAFGARRGDLEPHLRAFSRSGRIQIHRFILGEAHYVQWLFPLRNREASEAWSTEGLLLLDPEVVRLAKASVRGITFAILVSVAVTALLLYPLMLSLHRKVARFADDLVKGNLEIASILGTVIAQRDSETGEHSFRVTLYAIRLAEALAPRPVDMRALIMGAFLHDAGKIGIPDAILLKPGRLTEEEFAVMQTHVRRGLEIIRPSRWLEAARGVIEFHHEQYDGSGYLQGLKGEAIPLPARIFAIVDAFDALTSRRPYREPLGFEAAMVAVEQCAGTHFDPALVEAFLSLAEHAYRDISGASEPELMAELLQVADRYPALELTRSGHGGPGQTSDPA